MNKKFIEVKPEIMGMMQEIEWMLFDMSRDQTNPKHIEIRKILDETIELRKNTFKCE
ncbi:hypothetical protein LCGC14_1373020 [marine sediment metagenome]|uniref:Uncharacterized protein n=1 Tax=marine sediment metagenome TaxID=412755 RepID=A0A0F9N6V2_9ZZZZ